MPKDEFNLDEFLAEREFADDAEREIVSKVFSREKNQRAVLAQKAFDRKMDAAKADFEKQAQTLADKQATLDALVTQNIEYKGKAESAVEEVKTKLEKEIKVLQGKVAKAADLAGVEPDDIDFDLPTPKPKKAPDIDLAELDKKYVTGDALNRLATGHVNLVLELDEIKDAFEELNGKKLTRSQKDELLKQYNKDIAAAQRSNSAIPTLMQTADRLYEFSDARSKLEQGKLDKLVADAEARGRQKAIQEMGDSGLPTPRRAGTGSVLFADKTRKPTDPPVRDRGIKLAVEALEKKRAAA